MSPTRHCCVHRLLPPVPPPRSPTRHRCLGANNTYRRRLQPPPVVVASYRANHCPKPPPGARRRRRLLLHRFDSHFSHRLDGAKQFLGNALLSHFPRPRRHRHHSSFASLSSHHHHTTAPNHAFDLALTPNFVANTLSGTFVYTVSNSNNEFFLLSDPNSLKSFGLLCFHHEDADALLA
ncbi:hypothetical protein Syun_018659 [Stephania yunnanensis]|uniref:Uncharacterized protein n=1 Tax=Stephania yunnanensis TaxID=152371 RepID=A0AAP0NV82_9MAGN